MSLRKDLHYSLGKIKTDVWSKLAKQNPLQTPDTKALSLWIFEERNDLAALRLSAYHQQETRKAFLSWTEEESEGDNEDITDIGEKLAALMEKQQEIENDYIKRYRRYRQIIKSIRERDQTVLSSERERKKSLEARIQHLQKTNPSSKQIAQFEQKLSQLRQSVQEKENQMNDYKRFALREAFHLKFNAMQEYAEKSALLASFGKYLVDLLDIAPGPRPPYDKHREADMIVTDCMLAVDGWHPPQARPSTLLSYLEHDKQEDAQLLTDEHIEETLPAYDAATMINEGIIEDEKTALEKYLTTVDYNQLYQRIIQGKKK